MAEYPNSAASRSRYCVDSYVVESFARQREEAIDSILKVVDQLDEPPVLFPTADPDLRMLSECRHLLEPHCRLFVSQTSIVESCMDKGSFSRYASQFDVPLPKTAVPHCREDVISDAADLRYPIIVKPAKPDSWNNPEIALIVSGKKAVVAKDSSELMDWYDRIEPHGKDVVLQEYIPGRDDRLYSLHVYISKDGEPLGVFTGQKIRTWPTYAGIGCFVKSVYVPEIVESGLKLLRDMEYTYSTPSMPYSVLARAGKSRLSNSPALRAR